MVDHLSYFQYGPSIARNGLLEPSLLDWDCKCTDCKENEGLAGNYRTSFDEKRMTETTTHWDDEQYMLCPPRVLGYVLRDKQWAQLQVTFLRPIPLEDDKNAWNDRLRLADDSTRGFNPKDMSTKQLLFDLVRSHISAVPSSTEDSRDPEDKFLEVDDIVPDKGKGLVILLYGVTSFPYYSSQHMVMLMCVKVLQELGRHRRQRQLQWLLASLCSPSASLMSAPKLDMLKPIYREYFL